MTENLVSGKKYRILVDAANDIWDRISFWTKASDVIFNDGSALEGKSFGHDMLERSTAYTVGQVAYCSSAPSWVQLYCTTAGTTAATEPSTYGTISSTGTTITDGTAKFIVYDVRPTSTLSNNNYIPVTVGAVNASITSLQSSFQAGVDSVYDAIVAQGTTPASKSLSDVVTGIATMAANKYASGQSSKSVSLRVLATYDDACQLLINGTAYYSCPDGWTWSN